MTPFDTTQIGTLSPGHRNDGLTRLAGALRRKGASLEEIEREVFKHNERRCQPPLSGAEVSRIAMSVAAYPTGGPDPLEGAWQAIEKQTCESNFARFVALARQLQMIRPGQPVALPVDRIGKLMGMHWTTVGLYRKQAVRDGVLKLTGKYVAHRRAGTFLVALNPQEQGLSLGTLTSSLTNGLVRISENPPSEHFAKAPSENEGSKMETNERNAQVLRLGQRGFCLFPLKPRSKTPAISKWPDRATADPQQLAQWFAEIPSANWGLATGPASGLFALDIDADDGLRAFIALAGEHWGELAESTLAVRTANGSHLYFAWPETGGIKNSAGKLANGLDVRGERGYVVCPPSMHDESGEPYRWLCDAEDKAIAAAPSWLLERIQGNEKMPDAAVTVNEARESAAAGGD